MRKIVIIVALLALLFYPGCAVTQEVKDQIMNGAVIGDANLDEWETLTPAQRHEAYWKNVRLIHDLDYAINKKDIPEEFKGDYAGAPASIAPPTSASETEGDGLLDGDGGQ